MSVMKVAIGADHRGVRLKNRLKKILEERGHAVRDFGAHAEESSDYPDYALPLSEAVAAGRFDRGILVCGSGIGMSIAANRVPGVRGTLCMNEGMARTARSHNNSNVLCLAADLLDETTARRILQVWLETDFEGGRHARRLRKIDQEHVHKKKC